LISSSRSPARSRKLSPPLLPRHRRQEHCPRKTGEKVADTIRRYNKVNANFDVVSNPEFLREGSAIDDLMKPDRIVIGSTSDRALAVMKKVYEPLLAPIMVTDVNSAELLSRKARWSRIAHRVRAVYEEAVAEAR
jgi:UDP-glucose 6-dehydrogenase